MKYKTRKISIVFFILIFLFLLGACFDDSSNGGEDNDPANGNQLFERTSFSDGVYPWILEADKGAKAELVDNADGEIKIHVSKDVLSGFEYGLQFSYPMLEIQKGKKYELSFEVKLEKTGVTEDSPFNITAAIAGDRANVSEAFSAVWGGWGETLAIEKTGKWMTFKKSFTMAKVTDPSAKCYIRFGGQGENYNVWIRNVSLVSPETGDDAHVVKVKEETESSIIRVNQLGYLPNAVKRASIVLSKGDPSYVPQEGEEKPEVCIESLDGTVQSWDVSLVRHAYDDTAGEYVAVADFSAFRKPGTYRISATYNGETELSHEFTIGSSIYSQLKNDAIDYFYYNRIGEVTKELAAREDLARSKGENHTGKFQSLSVNNYENDDFQPAKSSYEQLVKTYGSDFEANIQSGWYDAGDYGMYVVNGGIAVWTLLNWYERSKIYGKASEYGFADGSLRYEDGTNETPDIVDLVEDELNFMLAMQEKDGDYVGMVHHKIHQLKWSDFPSTPDQDAGSRIVFPVSTAATLNFAAVAAQAARIYKNLASEAKTSSGGMSNQSRGQRFLEAAELAWDAAKANPAVYAPNPAWKPGGGPYDDTHLSDEFFWAAAELYIATGKDKYLKEIVSDNPPVNFSLKYNMDYSLSAGEDAGFYGSFTWGNTGGLGVVSLALAPKGVSGKSFISNAIKDKAREGMIKSAEIWKGEMVTKGYGTPVRYLGDENGNNRDKLYPWGSNSFILNMAIVFGYVHDFTGDKEYLNALVECMDYILGRNAMDTSYVTGYGERAYKNPHHRVWANQYGPEIYPEPARGAVTGGPNNGGHCPFAYSYLAFRDVPPQKSYIDHIQAWSTNEITVNWNAPLVWTSAYLDEKANFSDKVSVEVCVPRQLWMTGGVMTPTVGKDVPLLINTNVNVDSIHFFYADKNLGQSGNTTRYEDAGTKKVNLRKFTHMIARPSADFKNDDSSFSLYADFNYASGKIVRKEISPFLLKRASGSSSDIEFYGLATGGGYDSPILNEYVAGATVPVVVKLTPSLDYYYDNGSSDHRSCKIIHFYAVKASDDITQPSSWKYLGQKDLASDEFDDIDRDSEISVNIEWTPDGPGEYIYVIQSEWSFSYTGAYIEGVGRPGSGGFQYFQYDISSVLEYGSE
ncbi:MAG: glycoside hydrolase family 9 protein [Spirochaetes bacterium]|nr:glycoside hydrolase family 9 protein [Spirochaetota bacterium]